MRGDDSRLHEPTRPLGRGLAARLVGMLRSRLPGRRRSRLSEHAGKPAPRLLAVEIVGFEEEDARTQAAMRFALDRLIVQSLDDSGIDLTSVTASPLLGTVMLEAQSQSAALQLLRLFPPRLAARLALHNRDAPASAKVRVRAVIHVRGSFGEPPVETPEQLALLLGMLDPRSLKSCAPSDSVPMVLLATGWTCNFVHGDGSGDHQANYRLIEYECTIAADGTQVKQRIWLHLPGSPRSLLLTSSLHLLAAMPVECAVLAVDIEAYGDPARRDSDLIAMRRTLRQLLEEILSEVDIDPIHISDPGDELLVVFPPETSNILLIDPVVTRLASRLARYNPSVSPGEIIRVRAVVNRCCVAHDGRGLVGRDLNTTHRLLNSRALHRQLRMNSHPVALIVSDDFYRRVIAQGFGDVDPAAFQRVRVNEKETRTHAWVALPWAAAGGAGGDGPDALPPGDERRCE